MAIRDVVRGRIDWDRLAGVFREFARRHDREYVRVEFVEADNWLSIPCVVDDEYFVKVITPQNSIVQSLFTAGRNLGAVSSGTGGFFERADDPLTMAEHELAATERMREAGIDAPEPVEAFEAEGLGVLVLEYLKDFRTLEDCPTEEVADLAPELFDTLARLHEQGLVHGDLQGDNVLVLEDALYLIDATHVRDAGPDARAYDLACAIGMLVRFLDASTVVEAALSAYSPEELLAAREFLDFVNLRPDHEFDAPEVIGEIEKVAA